MRGRGPIHTRPIRFAAALIAALCVILTGLGATAVAQEAVNRPWSLRDILYPKREQIQRGSREQVQKPSVVPREPARAAEPRAPQKAVRKSTAAKPAARTTAAKKAAPAPEPEVVAKAPDAKVVLVVGDFIAGAAAEGLAGLFSQNAKVRIVDRSSGASGLVRTDHLDWPSRIAAIIEEEKPAAVLMAVGANDRQTMRIGTAREPLRSEAWIREYTARVASFASEVAREGVPLVWLGTPSFKSTRMNADMLAFNEIYRSVAADGGLEFVEVWDGFVDEAGKFVSTGPDISGQPVRLRTEDGINLTSAGRQKLAFYSEKELKRLLGIATTPSVGGQPGAVPTPLLPGMPAPADRTPPIALADPALDGGETLLGASLPAAPRTAPPPLAASPVAGRADDFTLPASRAAETAPDTATTSALRGGVEAPAAQ